MARPYLRLPPGARKHLEAMAEAGLLSETRAATALGMPLREFRRVIRDHPDSREVWENALIIERDALLGHLYERSAGGDPKAAQTLLAIRHGLTEKQPAATAAPSVVINLPGAMDAAQYLQALQPQPPQLPEDVPHG